MSLEQIRELAQQHVKEEGPAAEARAQTQKRLNVLGSRTWAFPRFATQYTQHFHRNSIRYLPANGKDAADLDRTYTIAVPGEPDNEASPDLELKIEACYVIVGKPNIKLLGGVMLWEEGFAGSRIAFDSMRDLKATWLAKETGRVVSVHALSAGEIESTSPEVAGEVLGSLEEAVTIAERILKR
jgi:hypothetical protein